MLTCTGGSRPQDAPVVSEHLAMAIEVTRAARWHRDTAAVQPMRSWAVGASHTRFNRTPSRATMLVSVAAGDNELAPARMVRRCSTDAKASRSTSRMRALHGCRSDSARATFDMGTYRRFNRSGMPRPKCQVGLDLPREHRAASAGHRLPDAATPWRIHLLPRSYR